MVANQVFYKGASDDGVILEEVYNPFPLRALALILTAVGFVCPPLCFLISADNCCMIGSMQHRGVGFRLALQRLVLRKQLPRDLQDTHRRIGGVRARVGGGTDCISSSSRHRGPWPVSASPSPLSFAFCDLPSTTRPYQHTQVSPPSSHRIARRPCTPSAPARRSPTLLDAGRPPRASHLRSARVLRRASDRPCALALRYGRSLRAHRHGCARTVSPHRLAARRAPPARAPCSSPLSPHRSIPAVLTAPLYPRALWYRRSAGVRSSHAGWLTMPSLRRMRLVLGPTLPSRPTFWSRPRRSLLGDCRLTAHL